MRHDWETSLRISAAARNSRQQALDRTFLPIAIGQALAALESLSLGQLYGKKSLLRGISAQRAVRGTLKFIVLTLLDSPPAALGLALLNFSGASALLLARGNRAIQIVASMTIAASNRLSEIRTPYGRDGADQMTAVITQYRVVSALIPDRGRSDDVFLRAVNMQAGLSYFVSGLSKLFGSSWVQGDALGEILQTQAYGGGPMAGLLRRRPRLTRVLSWITPLWEVSFPLVYFMPRSWGRLCLTGVKVFHIGVAGTMELPRFIWGFAGSHGAVSYVLSHRMHGQRMTSFERVILGSALAVVAVSGAHAAGQRMADVERRRGLRGTSQLAMPDGVIEYKWSRPSSPLVDSQSAPVVLLECGLGNALEAWAWVVDDLSADCHVLTYHRRGYGQTTSRISNAEMLSALIAQVDSTGPLVVVAHSIGLLAFSSYVGDSGETKPVSALVAVDGTDPELLAADRADRRRVGAYLQSQLHTMFAAATGVYNFAPNAVARQSGYAPDEQGGVLQFVFSPRNIYRATREFFEVPVESVLERIRRVPVRFVVGSEENLIQQRTLAEKLGAKSVTVSGSSHRSVLGYRHFAKQVSETVRRAIDAAS